MTYLVILFGGRESVLGRLQGVDTGSDSAVAMSSGSHLGTGSNPDRVFKGPMGRCMATTPSSLSLTSNRVTTIY